MSLNKSKISKNTFCIAPWTEMHFGVSKEVMPCCTYDRYNPFGNLNNTDSLEEIYNSENAKSLRKKLFNGEKANECKSCWNQEKLSENESYRQFHNEFYGKYIDEVLENTNKDFSLKTISPKRLDIRFDNKCNLKCRICNSTFSTSWYADEVKLGIRKDDKTNVYKESISNSVMEFILNSISKVDEIFFAGGEPLIQEGHYTILEFAVSNGYSSKIRLTYNTNFSSLKYKDKDIISLWKNFESVTVGASLDASHEQGEYQRKNIIWKDVEKNRKRLIDEFPKCNFEIIPTLSILNVYNLVSFHKEWVLKKYLNVNNITINLLEEPKSYDIRNLPEYHKERIKEKYNNHIKWLQSLDEDVSKCINEFKKAINFLSTKGDIEKLKEFLTYNVQLDKIRNEKFFNIYPEFSDLEWYLKYQTLKDDVGESAIETIGGQQEIIKSLKSNLIKNLKEITKLNKKIKEKDKFISENLHDIKYVSQLELERDMLHKKLAEKDSFISKALHDKSYITQLEKLRDTLNTQLSQKNSFINKTLIESDYINQVSKLKNSIVELKSNDNENLKDFFVDIDKILKRLNEKIKIIKKENGYKALL